MIWSLRATTTPAPTGIDRRRDPPARKKKGMDEMKTDRAKILAVGLLAALITPAALAAGGSSTFNRYRVPGVSAPVYYLAPTAIETGSRCETAAVIIHGWGGGLEITGDVAPFAAALAKAVGPSGVAPYVVAPLFPRRRLMVKKGLPDDGRAIWNDSWGRDLSKHGLPDDDWRGGGDAAGTHLSSFEVVDAILSMLGDKSRFPALKVSTISSLRSSPCSVAERSITRPLP